MGYIYSIGERLKYENNLSNETLHPGTDRPSNGADTVVGGKCFSSPYKRAIETAKLITDNVEIVEGLHERTIGEAKEDFWYKQYCDYNYSNAGGESALVILNGKLNPADYFIIRFGNDTITDIASYPQKRTAYRDLIAAGCSFSYDNNAKSRKGSGHGKCNYRKRVEKIL